MGFSLKMFLEDLEDIINDSELNDWDKVTMLAEVVTQGKIYAKECGQL